MSSPDSPLDSSLDVTESSPEADSTPVTATSSALPVSGSIDDADHADILEVGDDQAEAAGATSTDADADADSGSAPASAGSDLDEGDIAADYIEELLDILDLDGDIDIETRGGRSYISVDSAGENDLHLLSKPETVTALQELTRIAVQTQTGEFSRLILDVGGSRATREHELTTLVDRAISRIEEGATAASLPPMSSYERKLVHDIVAERGFVSESEGEGRDRHTVVTRG